MRKYNPCDKVIDCYPQWKICGRPTRTRRCELHPIRIIFAQAEEESHVTPINAV
mgnify:CR=1 FL=1